MKSDEAKMESEDKKITSVASCSELIKDLTDEFDEKRSSGNNDSTEGVSVVEEAFIYGCGGAHFPYGIFFRGEPCLDDNDTGQQLTPGIFRKRDGNQPTFAHEQSVFDYSTNRFPEFAEVNGGMFSKLCVLQHYGVPTRLLDWSENILVGLYFAVSVQEDGEKAFLYVLNGRKLNRITGMYTTSLRNMHDESSFGVEFRTAFVRIHKKMEWIDQVNRHDSFQWNGQRAPEKYAGEECFVRSDVPKQALEDHLAPVAVMPSLSHPRMFQQGSIFTLHGGKKYNQDDQSIAMIEGDKILEEEQIGEPTPLTTLNGEQENKDKFLKRYEIPAEERDSILQELRAFGINSSTLMPTMDKRGETIKQMF